MSENLTTLNIVAAGQALTYRVPVYNIKALVIGNESGYTCTVTLLGGDVSKTLYPSTVDWFQVTEGFKGDLVVLPTTLLTNLSSYTGASVIVDAIANNDPEEASMYPMALPRQAVSATASGKPIFAATVGFGSTATKYQTLNIFNPPGSGVTYTFHAARCFTNDSTVPAVNLLLVNGADLNLGTAVPAVSHAGSASPPVSTAHCTAEDNLISHGGSNLEVMDMQASVTQDFLDFPDSVTLAPGNNLYMQLTSGSTGHVVRLTMKWSEDIYTPPAGGLMGTIATQVINDGGPAGNPLVESTPAGGPQGVLLTTDGFFTLANLLKLLTTLDIEGGTTTVAGSVGGNVNFRVPIWGTGFKLLLITLGGFNSASAATFTLPTSITRGLWIASYNGSSTIAFGNVDVATGLGSGTARGGDISESQIFANSFGSLQITSATTVTVNSTGGVAVNGAVLVVGV